MFYLQESMLLINNCMSDFKPTTLYIKQHNKTGLKYFGKTTQDNPKKYSGSGLYWKDHLKVHGNDVTTVWSQLFEDKQSLSDFAIKFSEENNIVDSDNWANLKPENGLDGFTPGHKYGGIRKEGWTPPPQTEEQRRKNSLAQMGNTRAKALKGYKQNQEHIDKRMASHRGIKKGPQTAEHIESRFKQKQCEHCNGHFSPTNYSRWHGKNCKNK